MKERALITLIVFAVAILVEARALLVSHSKPRKPTIFAESKKRTR